jgi:hypothetical protein
VAAGSAPEVALSVEVPASKLFTKKLGSNAVPASADTVATGEPVQSLELKKLVAFVALSAADAALATGARLP